MKRHILAFVLAALISPALSVAQPHQKGAKTAAASNEFGIVADAALVAMSERAHELGATGVAVVAYFQDETIQTWSSKMTVVGNYKVDPTAGDKGLNLLAIAYAKAAEVADTHKDSGTGIRPPMTGEFEWTGGLIVRAKTGYLIAAFSGGKSDEDTLISQAGLAKLKAEL
ncbi:hypothetical protein [Acidicapsa ligni]|uniref:hypothetical protein n=1 Tax=Acidicapsa ligni TaxID=542300 RepID=UPI0021E06AC5|nr:hypothetical protein [Acidicapsa ligni]